MEAGEMIKGRALNHTQQYMYKAQTRFTPSFAKSTAWLVDMQRYQHTGMQVSKEWMRLRHYEEGGLATTQALCARR